MIINHIMIGSDNVPLSVEFYCQFLGFIKSNDDPGAPGGQVLVNDRTEILIIPFTKDKLPNPYHFALEVDDESEFNELLKLAEKMKLNPRATPSRSSEHGASEFTRGSSNYRLFYVFDPSNVNLEIMVKT